MKKFILKQWYPSLDNDLEVGDIVFYDKERGCYAKPNNRDIVLRKREVENNPDFWELIEEEKPKPIWSDYYLNKYRWYRKCRKQTWYKHQFTNDALELSITFTGTWWALYGKINRYSDVVDTEVW